MRILDKRLSNGSLLEQAKIVEFMSQAGAYASAPAVINRIETHASFVFLAGDFAYKLKRAVKLPFLDFSTLEKRHWACLNELRLNARTAPQLYLEVVPVVVDVNGNLCLRGSGKPVDWVLVMRRFMTEWPAKAALRSSQCTNLPLRFTLFIAQRTALSQPIRVLCRSRKSSPSTKMS
jgi:aminoglycoside phosphotransferase family enzyme